MSLIDKHKHHETLGAKDDWFARNIPFFECPDAEIEEIYYFRWKVFRKHIKSTPDGYVVTEFFPQVSWSGKHNTIVAPAAMHIYEGRWLRDTKPLDDYCRFWFRGGGEPRKYSSPLADAIANRALVTGDLGLAADLLPDLIENYQAWEASRQGAHGLFWQLDDREGQEFSIAGSGYRPPINSYMFADAEAIARVAGWKGETAIAQLYAAKARNLKTAVQQRLWDPDALFFKNLTGAEATIAHNAFYGWVPENRREVRPGHELADVRELFGYVPWTYCLPEPGYEVAWRQLFDEDGFAGEYGPTTAERRHPAFMQPLPHDCLWNGPSWPFATTQVLKAMANLLQRYDQREITRADYLRLLRTYAFSQHRIDESGARVPWIDESIHPDTGAWLTREALIRAGAPNWERGRDYNHSGYCDLIISGLCGLRPGEGNEIEIDPLVPEGAWDYWCLEDVPYHGKLLTILFDRDGSRYGQGSGLRLKVDDGGFEDVKTHRRDG